MTFLQEVQSSLDSGPASAFNHRFFRRLRERTATPEEIGLFAPQWFLAADGHKIAFAELIPTIVPELPRFGLIQILYDEYGDGDETKIHARLLRNFLQKGVGIGIPDHSAAIPEVAAFTKKVLEVWSDRSKPVRAFGLHYGLERIAQEIHKAFYAWLKDHFPTEVLEYFLYHTTAEEEHVKITEDGFNYYALSARNRDELLEGLRTAVAVLLVMWDGFDRQVFES